MINEIINKKILALKTAQNNFRFRSLSSPANAIWRVAEYSKPKLTINVKYAIIFCAYPTLPNKVGPNIRLTIGNTNSGII